MRLSTKDLLHSFFKAYSELELIKQKDLDEILENIITYRALERIISILAITTKRLKKLNPQWNVPHYNLIIKIKNQIIWDIQKLKKNFLIYVLNKILPDLYSYLKKHLNKLDNNEE